MQRGTEGTLNQSTRRPDPFPEHRIDSALPTGAFGSKVPDYFRRESYGRYYLRTSPLRTTAPSNRHCREFLRPAIPREVRPLIQIPVGHRSGLVLVHWALREIRVRAAPSWDDGEVQLSWWFNEAPARRPGKTLLHRVAPEVALVASMRPRLEGRGRAWLMLHSGSRGIGLQ